MSISPFQQQPRLATIEEIKWLALGQAGHFLAEQSSERGSLSREHETMSPAPLCEQQL